MKVIFYHKSKNNYFRSYPSVLEQNRVNIVIYLEQIKGYSKQQSDIYLTAYDYFVQFPERFDGATMTEDLHDIDDLELAAMLHDYFYIALNASASLHFIKIADDIFFSEMKKHDKSSWNMGYRKFALICIRFYWVWYCRKFKEREITIDNKITILEYQKTLTDVR